MARAPRRRAPFALEAAGDPASALATQDVYLDLRDAVVRLKDTVRPPPPLPVGSDGYPAPHRFPSDAPAPRETNAGLWRLPPRLGSPLRCCGTAPTIADSTTPGERRPV